MSLITGKSLAVDVWNPLLRGVSGRLLSYRQPGTSGHHCLSFYYKLYGPETGEDEGLSLTSRGVTPEHSENHFRILFLSPSSLPLTSSSYVFTPSLSTPLRFPLSLSLSGALRVKLRDAYGGVSLLWSRSGAHGNFWHEGHCPVSEQLTSFQV